MQPPRRGGLIVGRQHIDGIKRCQQLIGAQQELKNLSAHTQTLSPEPLIKQASCNGDHVRGCPSLPLLG